MSMSMKTAIIRFVATQVIKGSLTEQQAVEHIGADNTHALMEELTELGFFVEALPPGKGPQKKAPSEADRWNASHTQAAQMNRGRQRAAPYVGSSRGRKVGEEARLNAVRDLLDTASHVHSQIGYAGKNNATIARLNDTITNNVVNPLRARGASTQAIESAKLRTAYSLVRGDRNAAVSSPSGPTSLNSHLDTLIKYHEQKINTGVGTA